MTDEESDEIKGHLLSLVCIMQNDDVTSAIAIAAMRLFKAYLRMGFTEEQALELLVAQTQTWTKR